MNFIRLTEKGESPLKLIHYSTYRNKMDRLHQINVFVAVVDTNGFAGAAR